MWKRRRERKTPIEKEGEKKKPYWQRGEEENNLLTKKTYRQGEEKIPTKRGEKTIDKARRKQTYWQREE